MRRIETSLAHVHDLAFAPRGEEGEHRLIAVGGAPGEFGGYEIFSWPETKPLADVIDHADVVYGISCSPDGNEIVTAAGDDSVAVWSSESGQRWLTLTGHSRRVLSVVHLPGSELLVSAGVDQSLRVWNRQSGDLVRTLDNHTDVVHDLALRPGGDGLPMIASAGADRTVRFWQPTIGRMVRFARLPAEPLSIAWTSDGRRLAVSCTDGHVRVMDPDTLEITFDEPVIDGWAYEVTVAPDSREAAVGGSGGQIRRVQLE